MYSIKVLSGSGDTPGLQSYVGRKALLQSWVQATSGLSSEKEPRGCSTFAGVSCTQLAVFQAEGPAACNLGIIFWKLLGPVRGSFLGHSQLELYTVDETKRRLMSLPAGCYHRSGNARWEGETQLLPYAGLCQVRLGDHRNSGLYMSSWAQIFEVVESMKVVEGRETKKFFISKHLTERCRGTLSSRVAQMN